MEILAPAGSRESLEAAVRSGADSVYLGASAFNARRNADNFDSFSLGNAIEYCHARHVMVYVTLNTIIFDSEREAFIACAKEVAEAGPDRVIMQDLGCIRYVREICPDLPICASTQMAVHNVCGAKTLEQMGIRQAVLARELTLDEIEKIKSEASLRLETFVHGAHCMSVSGNCYFSQALGERSGNRGLCAQPCRMNFSCNGRPYALSLKDLSFVSHVKELEACGVSALKIEGRMKRPEYVAAAVTAVRNALAGEQPDMEGLKNVFSRSGFTDGYLVGKRNGTMFGIRSEADVQSSKNVLGRMADLYRNECKRVPVSMKLDADRTEIVLSVSDNSHESTERVGTVETETGVLTEQVAERALSKTGGTPFYPSAFEINIESDLHVQSSRIAELRRKALEKLMLENAKGIKYSVNSVAPSVVQHKNIEKTALRIRFASYDQIVLDCNPELVILPIAEIEKNPGVLKSEVPVSAELPVMIYPGKEKEIVNRVDSLITAGLRHVNVGNIGIIPAMKEKGLSVHGDYTLNISNSDSLREYAALGLSDALLSPELMLKQAENIDSTIPRGVWAYGRLPLMYLRSCPARTEKGCGSCDGRPDITDEKNAVFPIRCMNREYSVLFNSVPTYLADLTLERTDFHELYFTIEKQSEVEKIIHLSHEKGKPEFAYTRGHALKPVR